MYRLHLNEAHNAVFSIKDGELLYCHPIDPTGVGIANMRVEEVAHPRMGFWPRCEELGPTFSPANWHILSEISAGTVMCM